MVRIGVLSPFLGSWYHGGVLSGIARSAAEHDATVLAVQTVVDLDSRTLAAASRNVDLGQPPPFNEPIGWEHVAGFVMIGAAVPSRYVDSLKMAGKPVVVVGHPAPGFDYPAVVPDNVGGVRRGVEHLVGHGHTRIAFAGFMDNPDVQERYDGFRAGLVDCGIEPDAGLLFQATDKSESGGHVAAQRMLAAGLPSTAVVAATDSTAIGLMNELITAGCELPAQQAVIGFGNIEEAAYTIPLLATTRYSPVDCGAAAVAELMNILRGEATPATGTDSYPIRRVPTTLAIRESCGCTADDMRAYIVRDSTGSRQVLSDRMYAAVAPWLGATSAAEAAWTTIDTISATVTGERTAPTANELNGILENIVGLTGRASTLLDLGDVIRSYRNEWPRAADSMLFLLLRAHGRVKHNIAGSLLVELGNQHEVSTELLRSAEENPRRLAWLARTATRFACLGLWTVGRPPSVADPATNADDLVDIVGTYHYEGSPAAGAQAQVALASFPPADLIDLSTPETGEIASVIPIALGSSDWGLLAVVSPIRLAVVSPTRLDVVDIGGREAVNQYATLLTIALDEEQVLRELRLQERELRAAAMHDHLTGLPNRTLLLNKVSQAIHQTKSEPDHHFAVLFFDLDGFKDVNDTLGHPAGDQVLKQVAKRITGMLRPFDTAARLGGDEFVILLDGIDDPDEPARMARRLEAILAQPNHIRGHDVVVTASVGVTVSGAGHRDADDILRDADIAMYSIKSGRRPTTR